MKKNNKTIHLLSGASGLIGQELSLLLCRKYDTEQYTLRRLVRSKLDITPNSFLWNPEAGDIDSRSLEDTTAVIHLAGANIASKRWSKKFKEQLRASRVRGTETLVRHIKTMVCPPKIFLCASATGYYGDQGDVRLTEESSAGGGFLSETAAEWESIALSSSNENTRVVLLRFGIVLSSKGGALAKLLPIFKCGLGGPLGSGKQYMSWISVEDATRAISYILDDPTIEGAVNITSPEPVTNEHFTRKLGSILHRPTVLRVPATLLRIAVGEIADGALLPSCRAIPEKLLKHGFSFQYPSLESALQKAIK